MNIDESLRRYGLIPEDADLVEIRHLLACEAEAERRGTGRKEDLALLCCVQLFSRGQLDDVLRIWDAKRAGMDLGAYLDVQLLCGAGMDATKAYLAKNGSEEALDALYYIEECEQAGDFEGFSPDDFLRGYRSYFDA